MDDYIKSLPTYNNSRAIIRGMWEKYQETKSPRLGRELEAMTGIPYDEKDYGGDQNIPIEYHEE